MTAYASAVSNNCVNYVVVAVPLDDWSVAFVRVAKTRAWAQQSGFACCVVLRAVLFCDKAV